MDFSSLKGILKNETAQYVIIEDGKPTHIILPIEVYRRLVAEKNSEGLPYFLSLPRETESKSKSIGVSSEIRFAVTPPEAQLEDLPF